LSSFVDGVDVHILDIDVDRTTIGRGRCMISFPPRLETIRV